MGGCSSPEAHRHGATSHAQGFGWFLVYGEGTAISIRTLVWVDRQGQEEPFIDEPGDYFDVRISPDYAEVAVDMRSSSSDRSIWIYEIGGAGRRTRLASDGGVHSVWSSDGAWITYEIIGSGLYRISTDGNGEAEPLFAIGNGSGRPGAWSPDGQLLVFDADSGSGDGLDIWTLPRDGEPSLFLSTPSREDGSMFSPDGRWIAYTSDESGQQEVYVQPYPGSGRKYPISTGGGRAPLWSGKGDELFYRSLDAARMMAVPVELEPEFRAGAPHVLFEQRYFSVGPNNGDAHYDVSPDGQRFLMIKEGGGAGDETAPAELIVVLNWHEELKRLVPTD